MRNITLIILILFANNCLRSQAIDQTEGQDPFIGYSLPITLGIIEFENDNEEKITDDLYNALISNPTNQKKFNIFPYSALLSVQNVLKIRNFKDLNETLLKSLRTNINMEFIVTGAVIDKSQVFFKMVRTIDGKIFYNKIYTGNNKEEILNKIVFILAAGKENTSPNSNMVLVDGGVFNMGYLLPVDSVSWIDVDEIPPHEEQVKSFYIDINEVTVLEYRKFCNATNRAMPVPTSLSWEDNNPITNITWEDAKAFAEWNGKRLPTEVEWEFAARGGNKSKGYDYSGSNSFNEIAWFYPNSGNRTHPVCSKKENELGIFDMSGNVWEWCSTDYIYYNQEKLPANKDYLPSKVIRGGSFKDYQRNLRVCNRSRFNKLSKADDIGFRCVKDVEK